MKILSTILILCVSGTCLVSCTGRARLYKDSEIKTVCEKFTEGDQNGGTVHNLNIVPNGKTKKVVQIFEQLGLDPKRLDKPRVTQKNMGRTYMWRVSPGFALSIYVATNDPDNNFWRMWNLNGYGVRLLENKE